MWASDLDRQASVCHDAGMSKELTALRKYRPRDERRKAIEKLSAIRAALAAGHTQTEIADALGVSRQRVSEIIRFSSPERAK